MEHGSTFGACRGRAVPRWAEAPDPARWCPRRPRRAPGARRGCGGAAGEQLCTADRSGSGKPAGAAFRHFGLNPHPQPPPPGTGGEPALRTPLAGLGQDEGVPALGRAPLEVLLQSPSHTGRLTHTTGSLFSQCAQCSRTLPSASASGKSRGEGRVKLWGLGGGADSAGRSAPGLGAAHRPVRPISGCSCRIP